MLILHLHVACYVEFLANVFCQIHEAPRWLVQGGSYIQEAGVNPKSTVESDMRSSLSYLPADLWLRVLSHVDMKTLFASCALVCHPWLGFVYDMTEKHLSFTGDHVFCGFCTKQVSQFR